MGVHNYYSIATHVNIDFHKIAFDVKKSLYNRLKHRLQKKGQITNRYIKEKYGTSREVRYLNGHAIVPIAYVQHRVPMDKKRRVNKYTPEGRVEIHKNLAGINMAVLYYLMNNPCGKENAGAALLDACKEVKTSDPVQIGSYRGYAISVEFSAWKQEYTLLLKGQMTHRATLGTDPRGNLTRIDNALAQMPQRLEAAKAQLDNLYQQQAAAKEEVGKPFLYEEELRSKNARLVELDTLLNIDGKGQAHAEAVVAKSTRPSVLDHLKRPVTPRSIDKKPKQHEEVR